MGAGNPQVVSHLPLPLPLANPYPFHELGYFRGEGGGLYRVWRVRNPQRVAMRVKYNVHYSSLLDYAAKQIILFMNPLHV